MPLADITTLSGAHKIELQTPELLKKQKQNNNSHITLYWE